MIRGLMGVAILPVALSFIFGAAGCQNRVQHTLDREAPSSESGPAIISISGSSTMMPLVDALARNFEALHPGVRIEVTGGGSTRALENIRSGSSDISMVSRNFHGNEQDLQSFPIARDGVGIVVRQDNPVTGLTSEQIRLIYTGKATSWRDVGGLPEKIVSISREKGRSALDLLLQHLQLPEAEVQAALVADDNRAAFKAVLSHSNSITFVSVGESERNVAAGMRVKLLAIDGIPATSYSVSRGHYPLVRPLMLVTRELPKGTIKQFLDFCLSTQATAEIVRFDFIPYMD
jgi:phosphate transport system substrate-binding protein